MGGHIVIAFGCMNEHGVAIGDKAGEEGFQIAADVRIGILLNQQGGGSVSEMESKKTVLEAFFGNPLGEVIGDFVKAAATG
jgi:hypothetical protein